MTARQAFVLIADEALFSLTGKIHINGWYTADITIPSDGTMLAQLIFLFVIQTDVRDPFKSLAVEVTMPGGHIVRSSVALPANIVNNPERNSMTYRVPLIVRQTKLHAGKIEAKVIHEKGELDVVTPWIIVAPTL